jgi:S1-C subfamily serine protease
VLKALLAVAIVAVAAGGAWAYHAERVNRREDVSRLQEQVGSLRHDLAASKRQELALAERMRAVAKRVRRTQVNLVPLAARVRRSVFTLKNARDEGTGWAAWVKGRSTYVLTANHVVVLAVMHHELDVRLLHGRRRYLGRIIRTDPDNDLALIQVHARIAPPLWQRPVYTPPLVGDELLLAGAPEGYGGSVTSGVVSRVSRIEIQTDVSAHPGVSGGPLLDSSGVVVGVLVSGEGENLNFAVPIGRACARLRHCRRAVRRGRRTGHGVQSSRGRP